MTVAEVNSSAIVDSNIDTAYIDQYILMAQRKFIRPFIGNDYYEELTTQIAASTLTADNTTLLDDYIKPALAHYIVYESLPQLRNQIAKGGVYLNLSDTSDAVSDVGYGQIRTDYVAKAEALREEIDFYIKDARKDDSTKYPLYCGKNSQNTGIIIY
jgi:hypothetical protein